MMSPVLPIKKLFTCLALIFACTIVADPIKAQPVGGPMTGGNDRTGGNTTGGNTPGGNTPGGNVNTGGNVGVNVGEERRFTVTFKTFFVYDETGCDICGSDEVLFVIRTPDYSVISSEYEELDSSYVPLAGDLSPIPYGFDRCAQPAVDNDNETDWKWECDPKGKAAPFSFTVAAYETDGNLFSSCYTDQVYRRPDGQYTDLRRPDFDFCIEEEDRAELIGKENVELTLNDLAELQEPGQLVYKDVVLRGGCDGTEGSCAGEGGGPHYGMRYEVKRLPDAAGGPALDPNP
jgi:hypothetical protein